MGNALFVFMGIIKLFVKAINVNIQHLQIYMFRFFSDVIRYVIFGLNPKTGCTVCSFISINLHKFIQKVYFYFVNKYTTHILSLIHI